MDSGRQGDRRAHRLLIPVLLMLLIGMTALLISEIRQNESMRAELRSILAESDSIREQKVCIDTEIEKLRKSIETVKNLPQEAETARQKFFEDASRLEKMVRDGNTDIKIAYLTFDDGPYEITDRYLDVLEMYGVLATFFQRGRDWNEYGAIYRRVALSGHTIGNHTYSHQIRGGIYRSVQTFMDDVLKNRKYIEENLGITTQVLRFPGGSGTAGSLKQGIIEELRKEGYAYVNWNSATMDGMYDLSADEYRDNVLNRTNGREFLVVLMHDYSKETLKALPEIIEGLEEQGYVFLPLFYESLAVNR